MNALQNAQEFQTKLSRLDKRHPEHELWRSLFLRFHRQFGTLAPTCDAMGIATREVRRIIRDDPEFAEAIQDATLDLAEDLIAEAIRRAKGGSDLLLMFTIKKYNPSFKETYQPTSTITVNNTKTYIGFDPDAWDKLTQKPPEINVTPETIVKELENERTVTS